MSTVQPGRPQPVVDLPASPTVQQLSDILQRTLGKLVSLTCVPLFVENTLVNIGSPGSTLFIKCGAHYVNWGDTGVDEVRIVGYGTSTDTATKLDYQVAGSPPTSYYSMSGLPSSAGWFAGPWIKVILPNADLQYSLVVTLASGKTCGFNRIELQARSSHFQG